jgi:hypothetical protein
MNGDGRTSVDGRQWTKRVKRTELDGQRAPDKQTVMDVGRNRDECRMEWRRTLDKTATDIGRNDNGSQTKR